MSVAAASVRTGPSRPAAHPVRTLIIRRAALGILTLFLVSVVVFLATEVLPGNAALRGPRPEREPGPAAGAGAAPCT